MKKRILLLLAFTSALYATKELDTVVVTATKTQNKLKDISASMKLITKEDIQAKGFSSINDIIKANSNIHFMEESAVSIRGFNSNHSLILLNGKRISGGFASKFELHRIDISNIQRIEILKGSASSLYGADGLGGVINIITTQDKKAYNTLDMLYGTYNKSKGKKKVLSFASNMKINEKLNGQVYSSIKDFGDLRDKNNESIQRDGNVKTFGLGLDYDFNENNNLNLDLQYLKDKGDNYTKSIKRSDDNKRKEYSIIWNNTNEKFTLNSKLYGARYDKNNESFKLKSKKLSSFIKSKREDINFENQITIPLENHLLSSGFDFRNKYYEGNGIKNSNIVSSGTYKGIKYENSKSEINYYALFLQDEYFINDSFNITGALRYDDSNKFDSELSPRLGLVYYISNDLRAKFDYSHGFKSPSPGDLYKYIQSANKKSIYIGNDKLKSEQSDTFDISLEKDFSNTSSKVSLFYSKVDDLIDRVYTGKKDPLTSYKIYTYENLSKAKIKGLELGVKHKVNEDLKLSFDYTYLDAKGDLLNKNNYENLSLENRPKHTINTKLSYKYRPLDTDFNLYIKHIRDLLLNYERDSKTKEILSKNNKSYTSMDLSVIKPLSKNSTLYFGVDNILNKKDDEIPLKGAFTYAGLRFNF